MYVRTDTYTSAHTEFRLFPAFIFRVVVFVVECNGVAFERRVDDAVHDAC